MLSYQFLSNVLGELLLKRRRCVVLTGFAERLLPNMLAIYFCSSRLLDFSLLHLIKDEQTLHILTPKAIKLP